MLAEKKICTGCGACAASCPLNCIEMQEDWEGFRYPIIDGERCISCRKCESLCPVLNKLPVYEEPQAYGAKHKDDGIRSLSSSGGVFPALASFVLKNGGAVCGAAYAEDFSVEHRIIEDAEDIIKLQGAKYAQSRAERMFPRIRSILESGRHLLFTGTPCQTAGLKAYLRRDYENLILVDMICHGVPSPKVWKTYLEYRMQEDANGAGISLVNQRDKSSGWSRYRYSLRIDYQNGKTYSVQQGKDMFMLGFVNNLYLRPSCAQCQFKGLSRCADITLGDYWDVWSQHPEIDDDKGVSLVLVSTKKGAEHWCKILEKVNALAVDIRIALDQNPSAHNSSEPHVNREKFFNRMDSCDFPALVSEQLFGVPKRQSFLRKLLRTLMK